MPKLYDGWDLRKVDLPPATKLYRLEPVGVGTPLVESLSGHFKRLSSIHCLTPTHLFRETVGPLLAKRYLHTESPGAAIDCASLSRSFSVRSAAINSTGLMAAEWIRTLEQLIVVPNLRHLTLRPWSHVISQRHLIRSHLAWCPCCYHERRLKQEIVYEPLLWFIQSVTICPIHKCRLRTKCSKCKRALHALSRCSEPGYCSECGAWLGENTHLQQPAVGQTADELAWQSFTIETIGKLLAAGDDQSTLPSSTNSLGEALSSLMKSTGKGLGHLAKLIGKPKTTVWGWRNNTSRILLADLLRLCFCLRISPIDFFQMEGNSNRQHRQFLKTQPSAIQRHGRSQRKPIEKAKLQRQLRAIVERKKPPRSLAATAERLGVDKRVLYRHFPELSRLIASRGAAVRGISKQ
ncbi:MAG: DNA-binding transcriptional regulator, AcrR family [Acidobacteria bacterium]|nr:DNA-binding transcriptional regulator, AcrR family [Acidobacteriota bacterium]